jgi:hypothetical protein
VFEWGWFEEYRVAVMLVCELDRLYEMCGIDKGAAPFNILNEANVIQDKVKALIAPLVAQEACAI